MQGRKTFILTNQNRKEGTQFPLAPVERERECVLLCVVVVVVVVVVPLGTSQVSLPIRIKKNHLKNSAKHFGTIYFSIKSDLNLNCAIGPINK